VSLQQKLVTQNIALMQTTLRRRARGDRQHIAQDPRNTIPSSKNEHTIVWKLTTGWNCWLNVDAAADCLRVSFRGMPPPSKTEGIGTPEPPSSTKGMLEKAALSASASHMQAK
jgi:hypothetical protein